MDWTISADKSRLYFAYGSNMAGEQMRIRCRGHELVGIAKLEGYGFVINSRGVATIVPKPGSVVNGVVWSISKHDEDKLDTYEGVAVGLYRKEQVQVLLADGDKAEVMVYVAADSIPGRTRNGYLTKIIKAAERHGLPAEYVKELKGWG
jgi:gamma-glutamylcyclotransferase (GGCT)/AIG2-like uncharacterized protein YtfP